MESMADKRRTYTFYVDDAVLDVFGPRIGAYGVAVYALLARHAKQQQAFPSYTTMQKKLGISRRSAMRTMELLIEVGLVLKEKRTSDYGDPSSNLYTLVDLSTYHDHACWEDGGSASQSPPSASQSPPSASQSPPSASQSPGVVPHSHYGSASQSLPLEGISLKESHLKESDPPLHPPKGEASVINGNVATGKPSQARKKPNTHYTPGFLRFWEVYPHARRAKKPTCLDVWMAADLEPRTEEVCTKIERLKLTAWKQKELRFIPYTSSWLTAGCYEDDLQPLQAAPHEWAWVKEIEAQEASHARP